MRTSVAELNVAETMPAEMSAAKKKRTKTNLAETSGSSPPSLFDLESKIGAGIRRIKSAWAEVGLALGQIRDGRLYLPLNFGTYLAKHPDWGITRRHADRIIKSAQTADAVNKSKWSDWMPDVPNEAVARELAKLPEEKQAEVYAAACANCEGEEPTAKDIEEVAAKLFGGYDSEANSDGDDASADDGSEAEVNDGDEDGDDESNSGGDESDYDDDDAESEYESEYESESTSGGASDGDDDEADDDYVHDYVVTIRCKPVDSEAVSAAVASYRPKTSPLNTKVRFLPMGTDDLAGLLRSLANVVGKLQANIDLCIKAGAE